MLIHEAGMVRAIKRAYKTGGYVVVNEGDALHVYTDTWYIQTSYSLFPRKALALIVEHSGMIPEANVPTKIEKGEEPQVVMDETIRDEMTHWRTGERGEDVTMTSVIILGYQIYQPPGGGGCYGLPLECLEMMERDAAEQAAGEVVDGCRLLWEADGETLVIGAVRKTKSSWAKEWEQKVWAAMEGLDLHREG